MLFPYWSDKARKTEVPDPIFTTTDCRYGSLLVAGSPNGLRAVELGDTQSQITDSFQSRFPLARHAPDHADCLRWLHAVLGLVEDPGMEFEVPLDLQGTDFQKRVWAALREIPPGTTITYQQLAADMDQPQAVRAVAGACAQNPLALVIPCHRVLRSDRGLSGYRWDPNRKAAILAYEKWWSGCTEPEQGLLYAL